VRYNGEKTINFHLEFICNLVFIIMDSILANLNPKQKEAVTTINGPLLIIAGAGSGKTLCLTHRIAYLIKQGIPAKNILGLTFTNKAAQEMKERIKKLLANSKISLPLMGTFHSICAFILRQEIEKLGYPKNFVIYDESDQLSLIKQVLKELEINPEQFKPTLVREVINRAKDELINPTDYQNQAQDFFQEKIGKIYQLYQEKLKKANALDFGDLIMLCVALFQKHPSLLKKYQEKWSYILVDEYQDTNYAQYQLVKLLAEKHRNLCVCGDDWQNIFSFRGADIRNILSFEKDYPEAKVVILDQNYRSTQNILEAGHYVIIKNIHRKDKKLWTKNGPGKPINLVELPDEREEGNFIINEITNQLNYNSAKFQDFVVLYRTNAQSRAIEEAFLKANFPYKIIGTVRFYERKEIKDILAYLKLLINPHDWVSLERIINVPPRGIGKITTEKLKANHYQLDHQGFLKFNQLMEELRQAAQKSSLTKLLNLVIKKTKYEEYIKDGTSEGEKRWENIQELFTVAHRYDSYQPPLGLEKFLEEITLLTSYDEVDTQNLINLMTIHCAKGLEFKTVFVIGCEEGIFPHNKSLLDPIQMEEERRLCYVAITRAKENLYLTFTKKRQLFGSTMVNPPSRFLFDIPEKLVNYVKLTSN